MPKPTGGTNKLPAIYAKAAFKSVASYQQWTRPSAATEKNNNKGSGTQNSNWPC